MKKLLFFILFCFIPVFAFAEIIPNIIYTVTTKEISNKTLKINENIDLYVIDFGLLSDDIYLTKGDKISVKILEYVQPKRGKRNGYYKIEYKNKLEKQMIGTMRVSTPKDLKSIAISTGASVAGYLLKVPGFSQALAVSKGLIKPNENKTRIKSAEENLYKSTPLQYIERGKDFEVEEDGVIVLKLKTEKN